MLMTCWSVKGGSGTTVVATGLAVVLAHRRRHDGRVMLVDTGGDAPAALGLAEPSSPGLGDWLRSDAPATALDDLAVTVNDRLGVVPRGEAPLPTVESPRWGELATYLRQRDHDAVIDCGPFRPAPRVLTDDALSILVVRPCYMALRRVASLSLSADRLVLVDEPGRSLRRPDVENVVGQRVDVHLELDPAIARAVDAGLMAGRLPSQLSHGLRRMAA